MNKERQPRKQKLDDLLDQLRESLDRFRVEAWKILYEEAMARCGEERAADVSLRILERIIARITRNDPTNGSFVLGRIRYVFGELLEGDRRRGDNAQASLDDPLGDEGTCLANLIQDKSCEGRPPDELAIDGEFWETLTKHLTRLPDKERRCIELRFLKHKTRDDVAEELKITWHRVRRLETKALEKLKELMLLDAAQKGGLITEDDRNLFEMKNIDKLTFPKISVKLGIPEKEVRATHQRVTIALQTLASKMAE